jgi:translation initiation factor 2 subunit 3
MNKEFAQSQLNIGTLGHVDHGKTTLTKAITGVWTDTHSESIKRSMTIKLGYADSLIRKCDKCEGAEAYTINEKCDKCGGDTKPVRKISILDAPGHETLMATAIAGSNIIDAVIFVIAATEPCPMPQTKEHLMLINILGIKNIIIAQTKIDIVGEKRAEEHYKQIKNFIKGSMAENAPIIPVVASRNININVLLEYIANIKIPDRNTDAEPFMYIARSFDANRPGSEINKLIGGVVGGSIVRGTLKIGDDIEIRPGINVSKDKLKKDVYKPIITKIESLSTDNESLTEAIAGGLIGVGTDIDPSFTKADGLVGNVVGKVNKLPPTIEKMTLDYHIINRPEITKQTFNENEPVILGIGTGTIIGYVNFAKRNTLNITLKKPVCADKNSKISVLRNVSQRWRLSGYGTIK